ncbi:MAG: AraC family transcriptional regulator [Verrucomicrobiota bacterium]|nr:AraC family transcriptional regulator [Limisphaera sp.]MDW8382773.1 AraC family transcriptional regulator [Verrucomicrobiota bacterium]
MRAVTPPAADVTILGPHTRLTGVRAAGVELRPWIEPFPVCPALNQFSIIHTGIQQTAAPMRIVRTRQTTTYFLACVGGRGRVLIDGRWRLCRAGQACLLPAHTLNAFEAVPGSSWQFCWVCYQRPSDQRPLADTSTPVMAPFDPVSLYAAIYGLIHECTGPAQPSFMMKWAELVHAHVLRFAQPRHQPDQLRLLWERVEAALADPWTLEKLAAEAGYSKEHLRRLCRRQLGRSPMHQVTYLRMRRAAELLASTELTVDAVAHQVGYQNAFVFSNAFTRWIGWRPSEYRRQKRLSSPSPNLGAAAPDGFPEKLQRPESRLMRGAAFLRS